VTNKTGYTVELGYTFNSQVINSVILSDGQSTNAFNGRNATADWVDVASPNGGPNRGLFPFEIQYA